MGEGAAGCSGPADRRGLGLRPGVAARRAHSPGGSAGPAGRPGRPASTKPRAGQREAVHSPGPLAPSPSPAAQPEPVPGGGRRGGVPHPARPRPGRGAFVVGHKSAAPRALPRGTSLARLATPAGGQLRPRPLPPPAAPRGADTSEPGTTATRAARGAPAVPSTARVPRPRPHRSLRDEAVPRPGTRSPVPPQGRGEGGRGRRGCGRPGRHALPEAGGRAEVAGSPLSPIAGRARRPAALPSSPASCLRRSSADCSSVIVPPCQRAQAARRGVRRAGGRF